MLAGQSNWLSEEPRAGGTRAATFRVGFALDSEGQSDGVVGRVVVWGTLLLS